MKTQATLTAFYLMGGANRAGLDGGRADEETSGGGAGAHWEAAVLSEEIFIALVAVKKDHLSFGNGEAQYA